MGFMDKKVQNNFDKMFDLNKDGWLDPVEQGLQLSYIDRMAREMEADDDEDDFLMNGFVF